MKPRINSASLEAPEPMGHFTWCPAHDEEALCSCEDESIEDVKADFYDKGEF